MNRPTSSTAPSRRKLPPRSCRTASTAGISRRSKSSGRKQCRCKWTVLLFSIASTATDGAAPHPPAGTFSPYRDGEAEAPALTPPSPRLSRGEGKGVRTG
ncbi:MAG: hypothetical protein E5X83_24685 [Mesorhizobium sp.]|nr:MAG: hypothetical protein E5X83_24685 [Mesorhizobium sp.]